MAPTGDAPGTATGIKSGTVAKRVQHKGKSRTTHFNGTDDRTETVDRDETITVHGKRTEVVDGNEDITIHSNRSERVDHNETIHVGDNRSRTVGSNESVNVGSNQSVTVGTGTARRRISRATTFRATRSSNSSILSPRMRPAP